MSMGSTPDLLGGQGQSTDYRCGGQQRAADAKAPLYKFMKS